jgi:hypothetical protein
VEGPHQIDDEQRKPLVHMMGAAQGVQPGVELQHGVLSRVADLHGRPVEQEGHGPGTPSEGRIEPWRVEHVVGETAQGAVAVATGEDRAEMPRAKLAGGIFDEDRLQGIGDEDRWP